jgi:hypothetical protein
MISTALESAAGGSSLADAATANRLDVANKAARLGKPLIPVLPINTAEAAVHDATRRAIGSIPLFQA